MQEIVQGQNVWVSAQVDGDFIVIGCATSSTFTFKNELIGKTDVNAGLFRKRRVRISDCSASVSALLTLLSDSTHLSIIYFLQEGVRRTEQTLKFTFQDDAGVIRTIQGKFLVEQVDITAQTEDMAEGDINFQGTGGFSISDIDSPGEFECYDIESDWWQPANGENIFNGPGDAGRSFAGHDVVTVVREQGPPLEFTTGTPNSREYTYNGTDIGVASDLPFNGDEKVYVLWQETS